MVSEDPLNSLANRATASSVASVREVPNGACGCDNELRATNQESIYPESTEEMIQENVSSLLIPTNLGQKLKRSRPLLRFTH